MLLSLYLCFTATTKEKGHRSWHCCELLLSLYLCFTATTSTITSFYHPMLWIAFKFVSLLYSNNEWFVFPNHNPLWIAFKFVSLLYSNNLMKRGLKLWMLWIAFKFVSLLYSNNTKHHERNTRFVVNCF